MNYKLSRSLSGNKITWIARMGKKTTVIARADSQKALMKLLAARDEALKKPKSGKTSRKKKLISRKLVEVVRARKKELEKKPSPPQTLRGSDGKFVSKKKQLATNKLRTQVQEKKKKLETQVKTSNEEKPKKSIWDKIR